MGRNPATRTYVVTFFCKFFVLATRVETDATDHDEAEIIAKANRLINAEIHLSTKLDLFIADIAEVIKVEEVASLCVPPHLDIEPVV